MKKNSNFLYTIILYFLAFPKFLDKVKKNKKCQKNERKLQKIYFYGRNRKKTHIYFIYYS
jgi:putative lipase involved disintegration of autophagic bodies